MSVSLCLWQIFTIFPPGRKRRGLEGRRALAAAREESSFHGGHHAFPLFSPSLQYSQKKERNPNVMSPSPPPRGVITSTSTFLPFPPSSFPYNCISHSWGSPSFSWWDLGRAIIKTLHIPEVFLHLPQDRESGMGWHRCEEGNTLMEWAVKIVSRR